MTLALEYAFDSRPNPIRASPQDGPPNTITLTVGISNPGASLSIDGISIEFGGPNPSGWLTNQQFPTPSQPEGQNWSCHWSGRTLELEPNGAIEAPVAFVIEDIVVSAAQGPGPVTVPLTITEDNGQPDGTSYSLVKQPSDCIVTDFWADPASIDTLKQTVTLHWTVTDAGQTLDYQLEAGSWMPCQCLAPIVR